MPQKYEQEIDEILRRMETRLPREPIQRRLGRRLAGLAAALSRRLTFVPTPTGLLLFGLGVVFLGTVLRGLVPGVGTPMTVLALAAFVGALALAVTRSRRRASPGWRGRRLEYRSGEPMLWASLARRFQAWRESRRRRFRS